MGLGSFIVEGLLTKGIEERTERVINWPGRGPNNGFPLEGPRRAVGDWCHRKYCCRSYEKKITLKTIVRRRQSGRNRKKLSDKTTGRSNRRYDDPSNAIRLCIFGYIKT